MQACNPRRGFSLVELLLVIGVTLVLVSFAMPVFSRTRGRSLAAVNMSNIRQMGIGVWAYAESNKDLPPIFGPVVWPPTRRWDLGFGPIGDGRWFEQGWLYAFAITAELDNTAVANAAGRAEPFPVVEYRGTRASKSDYLLTHTLYASPAFFDRATRTGPTQFGGQHLASIAYPSSKGILSQGQMFHIPDAVGATACCVFDLPSPVVFADHSVSEHVLKRMPWGIYNPYASAPLPLGVDPHDRQGVPIIETPHGVAGRDR